LSPDSVSFDALGDSVRLAVGQFGHAGHRVPTSDVTFTSSDPTVVAVDSFGLLTSRQNGTARVTARAASGDADSILVAVAQQVHRVEAARDTLLFDALESVQRIGAAVVDRLGSPVAGAALTYSVADSAVAAVSGDGEVRARANGLTTVTAAVSGESLTVSVRVMQVPDTIVVALIGLSPILSLDLDAGIPLSCQVLDRNGFDVVTTPAIAPSNAGLWVGTQCSDLHLRRSGVDTLVISAGPATTRLPVPLVVRPLLSSALGEYLQVDSMPAGLRPWAPTLRRSSRGDLEIYFTGYEPDSTASGEVRGHLHRLVSPDGFAFRYDGIALQRDDSLCAPVGSGIENVVIAPRADAPGWRMFYSGGSFACYGWQVFSAVSSDERTWLAEPGVRLSNGGQLPPAPPQTPPWPVGEGMVLDRLASGEWRMIVGGYENRQPPADTFQIVQWRSIDQLNWTYERTLFTTAQVPPEGRRSVYSPTIKEIAPGLWRMIFTADNHGHPGGRSRLWTALSTDEVNWQFEGELIGAVDNSFYYSTLVDDRLVFLRREGAGPFRISIATVSMP
jgi:hypothetical protein